MRETFFPKKALQKRPDVVLYFGKYDSDFSSLARSGYEKIITLIFWKRHEPSSYHTVHVWTMLYGSNCMKGDFKYFYVKERRRSSKLWYFRSFYLTLWRFSVMLGNLRSFSQILRLWDIFWPWYEYKFKRWHQSASLILSK